MYDRSQSFAEFMKFQSIQKRYDSFSMGSDSSPSRLNDYYSDKDQGDKSIDEDVVDRSPDKSEQQYKLDIHDDFNRLVFIR